MKLGSKEHKAQWVNELLKAYHENIWNDELYRSRMETLAGDQRKAIATINLAIDNKEFKTKNEGSKALFVQERELQATENKIAELTVKIEKTWPEAIRTAQEYLDK